MIRLAKKFSAMMALAAILSSTALTSAPVVAQTYGGGSIAERAINDLSSRLGISTNAAAGLVGNFATETGNFQNYNELEPTVPGSRGGAGWAQWTNTRRVAFENYSASLGLSPTSYEANLEFAVHELTTDYSGSVLSRLRDPNISAAEAAMIVRGYYEVPGGARYGTPHSSDASRIAYANAYANGDFSGTQGSGVYDGTGGSGAGGLYAGFGGGGGGQSMATQPSVSLMTWGANRTIGAYPQGIL